MIWKFQWIGSSTTNASADVILSIEAWKFQDIITNSLLRRYGEKILQKDRDDYCVTISEEKSWQSVHSPSCDISSFQTTEEPHLFLLPRADTNKPHILDTDWSILHSWCPNPYKRYWCYPWKLSSRGMSGIL